MTQDTTSSEAADRAWAWGWYDTGGKKHVTPYLPTVDTLRGRDIREDTPSPFPLYRHRLSTQPNTEVVSQGGDVLREALEPVWHWYQSDDHDERPLLDIVRDVVADLQTDRQEVLRLAALSVSPPTVTASDEGGPTIPAGMKPWHGGDSAPDDWDGGPVRFRTGATGCVGIGGSRWKHPCPYPQASDIIAYTCKDTPALPGSDGLRLRKVAVFALDAMEAARPYLAAHNKSRADKLASSCDYVRAALASTPQRTDDVAVPNSVLREAIITAAAKHSRWLDADDCAAIADEVCATLSTHQDVSAVRTDSGQAAVDGVLITDALVHVGFCETVGEAHRLVRGGGVYVNDEKVSALHHRVRNQDIMRAGRKHHAVFDLPASPTPSDSVRREAIEECARVADAQAERSHLCHEQASASERERMDYRRNELVALGIAAAIRKLTEEAKS